MHSAAILQADNHSSHRCCRLPALRQLPSLGGDTDQQLGWVGVQPCLRAHLDAGRNTRPLGQRPGTFLLAAWHAVQVSAYLYPFLLSPGPTA